LVTPTLTPSELHRWLRSRRSVRRFRRDEVPPETIARILETATWAPNAHNRQPWRFVQLTSPESRRDLAAAMAAEFQKTLQAGGLSADEVSAQLERSRARIIEAPEAILLCLDMDVLDQYEDQARTKGEYLMGVQSVALAGGQLLLAAHAEGLAGVWMCAPLFTPGEVRKALALPDGWQAQGLVLLGWGEKEAQEKERLDIGRVKRVV
jgi:coenzyme F420-0:L-glutamate ligase/coenzyme F420-1:gamma-L-glutamate ligase